MKINLPSIVAIACLVSPLASLSQNATLITTFSNPAPDYDYFGNSVASVGTDRVLIGAYRDNMGALDAGVAYLFSTNGTLLTTFTNPSPQDYDNFGNAVAAVG